MIDSNTISHPSRRTVGKYLSVFLDDLHVSYTDEGIDDPQAILFIHGFPLNKTMWDNQMYALRNEYRVIAYDVRGHGETSSGNGKFSMTLFAEDLMRLMDLLGIQQAILCGHSMGGYIAVNAVNRWPDRFNGLILSNTLCVNDTAQVKTKRMQTIQNIEQFGTKQFTDECILNLLSPESYSTKKNEIDMIRQMIVHTRKETLVKTLQAIMNREETCTQLQAITIPCLVIVGADDRITPPAAARQINAELRDTWLSILPHSGHLCNMETPDQFNELVRELARKTIGTEVV